MTTTPNNTILVIGSTGKTGMRVADKLEKRGIPVRHGSRSADIPFDWENPQTWAPALTGVEKVYITYYPDLAVPGSVDAVRALTELAKDAGVRRLVLLSGRNEVEAQRAEDRGSIRGSRRTAEIALTPRALRGTVSLIHGSTAASRGL